MDTRKVQQLGPSTLAMTLPAEWTTETDVEKGDEVSIRIGENGTLTVLPESVQSGDTEATIHASGLDADAVERAIVAQYVLGRQVIHVEADEGESLESAHINAVYNAETQLMGLGVIEETPERITVRCSVDPSDFSLHNLLERLESTGSTMRNEAIRALDHGNPDLAQRALNRERQANKIFVLLLHLVFTAHQDPNVARGIGLDDAFPLIGYRSVAKNLELAADSAEDIADIALEAEGHSLDVDAATIDQIRDMVEKVDEISQQAVRAAVDRDYTAANEARSQFREIDEQGDDLLEGLEEMPNRKLLAIREVLVGLQDTAQYAVRNAEIATNLALDEESEHITLQ